MPQQLPVGLQTQEGGVEALKELLAASFGTAAKLKLYKSGFAPTHESVQADFAAQECDFTGYAEVPLTFDAVAVGGDGNPALLSNAAFFQNTTNVVGNVVGGAWLEVEIGPGQDKVVNYYPFNPQIDMNSPLAFIDVVVAIQAPDLSGYATVSN
jgi:hypothetical protein